MNTSPRAPFAQRVRELAGERGLTAVKTAAVNHSNERGVSVGSFDSAITGRTQPPVALMEAVADVLGIDPAEFDEYRCYLARCRLTPGSVSLAEATANADLLLSQTAETPAEAAAAAARRRGKRQTKGGSAHPPPDEKGPER